jgi:hypothetical protein
MICLDVPEILTQHCHSVGRRFNPMTYATKTLSPLSEPRAYDSPERDRIVIVHRDNAPHIAKPSFEFFEENWMKTAPRSPYSPNIVPSDFGLFGDVWPVARPWMQMSFLKRCDGFLTASKK